MKRYYIFLSICIIYIILLSQANIFIKLLFGLLFLVIILYAFLYNLFYLFRERSLLRVKKVGVVVSIFLFMFVFEKYSEQLNWWIFENKREQIVSEVKQGLRQPNVSHNGVIHYLGYDFSVISNGGNDILIEEQGKNNTIRFFISRGFLDNPSHYFIYTDNPKIIRYFEQEIKKNPKMNRKIKNNWYRIKTRL